MHQSTLLTKWSLYLFGSCQNEPRVLSQITLTNKPKLYLNFSPVICKIINITKIGEIESLPNILKFVTPLGTLYVC